MGRGWIFGAEGNQLGVQTSGSLVLLDALHQCVTQLLMLCAANKLRAVEEGKASLEEGQDPKLAIQPIHASSASGKAQFGSVEHLQQVENRRAVKVVQQPGYIKHIYAVPAVPCCAMLCRAAGSVCGCGMCRRIVADGNRKDCCIYGARAYKMQEVPVNVVSSFICGDQRKTMLGWVSMCTCTAVSLLQCANHKLLDSYTSLFGEPQELAQLTRDQQALNFI